MEEIQREDNQNAKAIKPCEFFDLICGTGMGGILAIMLGRLQMSVEDCISQYDNLISSAEKPAYGRHTDGARNSKILKHWLLSVIKSCHEDENAPLEDPREEKCNTFVLTMIRPSFRRPHRLRTYTSRSDRATQDCYIWQAALASAALLLEFNAVELGPLKQPHVEAGLGYNNPSREAIDEAKRIWSPPVYSIVNIGTGLEPAVVGSGMTGVKNLNFQALCQLGFRIAINRERVAEELSREALTSGFEYFRLNVPENFENIGTLDWDQHMHISSLTRDHLGHPETTTYINYLIKRLCLGTRGNQFKKGMSSEQTEEFPASPGDSAQTHSRGATSNLSNGQLIENEVMDSISEQSYAAHSADTWLDNLQKRVHPFVKTKRDREDEKVKIAVLDSGIDPDHPDLVKHRGRIVECQDWTSSKVGTQDVVGHGTHTTALLLKIAPVSTIYVAKVFDSSTANESTRQHVAEAISHAVHTWRVDIITMPFGFRYRSEAIAEAVQIATNKRVLLFGAASNLGSIEKQPAFPARFNQVFCINSADGLGVTSRFTPSARVSDDNFTLLGEAVESAWPTQLRQGQRQRKSGTSIATAIAAGIAALVLELAVQRPPQISYSRELWTYPGMRAIFYLMSQDSITVSSAGYYNVMPWNLLDIQSDRTYVLSHISHRLETL
ncbi:peptidase S8/S53 domain-containing protein [Aspergillus caelatus]|uniref:Peptidase S8/S53 domain-containing protein n=1 Tax=Aspergillus caelatus TaxID=61420 RepID=A0A5N6ZXW4_9EURO|nr:peptidase S8/S53 domain-containing protein [Aspergillus caelatus]KAE8361736.1 peptidase S8/S53 domain-containing protein [Aspergillus caelatus]